MHGHMNVKIVKQILFKSLESMFLPPKNGQHNCQRIISLPYCLIQSTPSSRVFTEKLRLTKLFKPFKKLQRVLSCSQEPTPDPFPASGECGQHPLTQLLAELF